MDPGVPSLESSSWHMAGTGNLGNQSGDPSNRIPHGATEPSPLFAIFLSNSPLPGLTASQPRQLPSSPAFRLTSARDLCPSAVEFS